ncbi:LysR family transcriptional regulator [Dokdonia pacifica]|uniref:DNA-binding transcriptional regulator, LysR family n=1 Tax=Dokdonia pacifica TaxID=1627892 RepID=A0A238VM68_9FLAO|nr:LysR family transcriptional regulator [Dokdonia pacifica]GGG20184.1 LysR family transcriptional regulator [Dokdonia pacifica]SNR35326.1 DNA-binding transcriptional regulator, LysR family [Dokdonia pacifica]
MNYTLHQLEIFHKIAVLKSVTKASEELFLTQPAVSIQLKKFQDQFQSPLFEVVGRKIYITEFGEEIAKAAANILEEVHALNYKALSFQGELAGKLKIAIVSTAKYAMPYFLGDFMKEHTGVDLIMDVTNKAEVVRSLENNDVDFAMVSTIPKNLKIDRVQLMENKLHLVGGKQYTHTGKNLSPKIFEQLPLIYREQGSATRNAMERFIASNKISTYKKMELTSNEAVKQAVVAGLGFSIMPLIGIKNELNNGDLQIIPVKDLPIVTNWNLIWLSSKNLSSIAKHFVEHINESKSKIMQTHFNWFNDY